MIYKLIILGRLPGLNQYTDANRGNCYKGSKMKKKSEEIIDAEISQQLRGVHITNPVRIEFVYYEPNKRRDPDNISAFARKVILDSLVKKKVLKNDGWSEIYGFTDDFYCDTKVPRIEVMITEVI